MLSSVRPETANVRVHPDLACFSGYLRYAVFPETSWLREVVAGDAGLTSCVRHFCGADAPGTRCRSRTDCSGSSSSRRLGDYEATLMVLYLKRLKETAAHPVAAPLTPRRPEPVLREVVQGHYRVGSRGEPFVYDNELPPQAVELARFRIAVRPVTNAEYLACSWNPKATATRHSGA